MTLAEIQIFIDTINAWLTGFLTMVLTTLNGFVDLFWTAGSPGELTIWGVLGLFSIAVGLVYMGLNFAKSFFLK